MKLTDTQRAILTAAAHHPEHLAVPPERLPAAARQTVAKALLKQDLVIAVHRPAYDAHALWMVDGDNALLKITDEGLRAIGLEPEDDEQSEAAILRRNVERRAAAAAAPEPAATAADTAPTGGEEAAPEEEGALAAEAAQAAPVPAPRASLREAAQRVLNAWDDEENHRYDLDGAIDALRQILAKPARTIREPGGPRKPREGTKQEQVLALLRRPEGATVAQIAAATGWAPHTVRGFFAGLKKRQGIAVEVLERVRQVGPNKEGARGSYTVYHIAG